MADGGGQNFAGVDAAREHIGEAQSQVDRMMLDAETAIRGVSSGALQVDSDPAAPVEPTPPAAPDEPEEPVLVQSSTEAPAEEPKEADKTKKEEKGPYNLIDEYRKDKEKAKENFLAKDRKARLEKYYGKNGFRKIDEEIAEKAIKGKYGFWQDFVQRLPKIGRKTAVGGALSLGFAAVLGGVSSSVLLPVLGGVAAGAGIRTAYEAIRAAVGKERRDKIEAEKANAAVVDKIEQLITEWSKLRLDVVAEGKLGEDLDQDERVKKLGFEIQEMMLDDTARRAKRVKVDGEVKYIGLRKDEKLAEGEEGKIINVGQKHKSIRRWEAGLEFGADALTAISTIAITRVLNGAVAAKKATETLIASQQAGKEAVKGAGEILSRGGTAGPFDFDARALPDNMKAHLVQAVQDGVKPYFDHATHVWHDSMGNLLAAIGKSAAQASQETGNVAITALKESQMRALIGVAVAQIVHSMGNRLNDFRRYKAEAEAEKTQKSQVAKLKESLNPSGEGGAVQTTEVVLKPQEQKEARITPGLKIKIDPDPEIREKLGIPSSFDGYTKFYFSEIIESDGTKIAVLYPIADRDNGEKLVAHEGAVDIPLRVLLDNKNMKYIVRLNRDRLVEPGEVGAELVEGGSKRQENKTPREEKEVTEEEKEKILAQIERASKMSEEKVARFRAAANWVFSRMTPEQFDYLHFGEHGKQGHNENLTDEAGSDKRWREIAKAVLKNEIVTHYAGFTRDNKTYFSDLDGKCSIGLMRVAGISIDTNSADTFVPPGGSVEGKVMVDTSGHEGVYGANPEFKRDDDGSLKYTWDTTGWADHHDPYLSGRNSSATALVYQVMTGLGMIDEEKFPYLGKMVEFVTKIDNAAYAGDKDKFLNSYKTLVGLGVYMNYDQLAQFFKDGRDPEAELSEEDLKKYGLIKEKRDKHNKLILDGGKPVIVNRQKEHKDKIEASLARLKELEETGMIVESDKFGKIVVDAGATPMKLKFDAIRSAGYDTYLLWNPTTESFFLSSKDNFPEGFALDQGVRVRSNMWTKGLYTDGELKIKLQDVVEKLVGHSVENPSPALEGWYEDEDAAERIRKTGERPEDQDRAADYWNWWTVSRSAEQAAEQKERLKEIIARQAPTGIVVQRVESVEEIDFHEQQRFSAMRLLAKEMGFKMGAFLVDMRRGLVRARIVKADEQLSDDMTQEQLEKGAEEETLTTVENGETLLESVDLTLARGVKFKLSKGDRLTVGSQGEFTIGTIKEIGGKLQIAYEGVEETPEELAKKSTYGKRRWAQFVAIKTKEGREALEAAKK